MIKHLILFTTLLFIYSCQNKQTAKSYEAKDTVTSHQDSSAIKETNNQITPTGNKNIEYIEGDILLPNASYRITVENQIGKILADGAWLELYKDQKGYKIAKANYTLTNEEEEPCSGLPTQTIETNRNSVVLFKIPPLKQGYVDTIAFKNKIIEPNKSLNFQSQGISYQLEASGINPLKNNYRDTPHAYYQLLLVGNGSSEVILYQTEYNDTVTEILFIGDLDKDGKVDFILSSPRDYEEERIIIILSSKVKHYEATRQFDC